MEPADPGLENCRSVGIAVARPRETWNDVFVLSAKFDDVGWGMWEHAGVHVLPEGEL